MHFDETNEGDYRIYVGALEAKGGYLAAVVVNRLRGVPDAPREAFRDTAMCGGHRWLDAQQALSFALTQAREVIRSQPERLGC